MTSWEDPITRASGSRVLRVWDFQGKAQIKRLYVMQIHMVHYSRLLCLACDEEDTVCHVLTNDKLAMPKADPETSSNTIHPYYGILLCPRYSMLFWPTFVFYKCNTAARPLPWLPTMIDWLSLVFAWQAGSVQSRGRPSSANTFVQNQNCWLSILADGRLLAPGKKGGAWCNQPISLMSVFELARTVDLMFSHVSHHRHSHCTSYVVTGAPPLVSALHS